MAQAMLAAEKIPEEVKALIVKKAEGNPFFVEEVVKSLQEIGVLQRVEDGFVLAKRIDSIFVPDTIQDVIMARIDRLEEAPKRTLQLASVIGREFTRRLLDRLGDLQDRHDEFLKTLKAIELIHEKSIYPELAYMFKHALTHEVAYNSLLVQRRKELHGFIARAIEELYADRLLGEGVPGGVQDGGAEHQRERRRRHRSSAIASPNAATTPSMSLGVSVPMLETRKAYVRMSPWPA
jgi:predicted ATPase